MKKTMWIGVLSFLISGAASTEESLTTEKALRTGILSWRGYSECERLKP